MAVLQENLDPSHYASLAKLQSPPAEPTLLAPHVIEPITHRDIAGPIGASREAISRVLKEMERSGHVILSHKRITLLKKLPDRY